MFSHMFLLFQLLLSYFFAPFLAARECNFSSCSRTIGTPSQYIVHAPPCFQNRTHGFLKARRLWEPGSSLTTGEFSLFRLLPKVSAANVCWTEHDSYLSCSQNPRTDTFLHYLGLAKLRSTARAWNHQGIAKLVNRLIVACLLTASLRFAQAIVRTFLATSALQWDLQRTPAIWHASQSQS